MTGPTMFRPLIHVDSITSTMDLLGTLARAGAPAGTTVTADVQTGGRGRSGRAWTAPPGTALLLSTLLRPCRPVAEWGLLALLAGVAVARTIDPHIDSRCQLKWPNDVLIEGRKVAGILSVARRGSLPRSSFLMLGIGVNVTTQRSDLPPGATSVGLHAPVSVPHPAVLDGLGSALARVHDEFRGGAVEEAVAEINDRLAFRDETVVIEDGLRQHRGRQRYVTSDGSLVLESAGRSIVVRSGELTRGPRPVMSRPARSRLQTE